MFCPMSLPFSILYSSFVVDVVVGKVNIENTHNEDHISGVRFIFLVKFLLSKYIMYTCGKGSYPHLIKKISISSIGFSQ